MPFALLRPRHVLCIYCVVVDLCNGLSTFGLVHVFAVPTPFAVILLDKVSRRVVIFAGLREIVVHVQRDLEVNSCYQFTLVARLVQLRNCTQGSIPLIQCAQLSAITNVSEAHEVNLVHEPLLRLLMTL